jgi:hypothetical protein
MSFSVARNAVLVNRFLTELQTSHCSSLGRVYETKRNVSKTNVLISLLQNFEYIV